MTLHLKEDKKKDKGKLKEKTDRGWQ